MNYGTVKAASTFAAGSNLPGSTTTVNSWRTQFPLTGSYPSGNWTFSFSVIGNGATLDGTGNLNLRVQRGALQGPPTTSILALTAMSSVSNLTTATAQNITLTVSMPAITLQQEYLFFAVAWVITVASTNASSGIVFVQDGVNSIITPQTFTPAPPSGIIVAGYGNSNNDGSPANPMYPQGGGVDSYLPPQQWLQAGGPVRQHLSSSGGPAVTLGFGPKNQTTAGGIVHTGGSPNNAAGTANQLIVGIANAVTLPPTAELPLPESIEIGKSGGIVGGYGGQTHLGFGNYAETVVPPLIKRDIFPGGDLPPYPVELPPSQGLMAGAYPLSGATKEGSIAQFGPGVITFGQGAFKLPGTVITDSSTQGIRALADPIYLAPLPPQQRLKTGRIDGLTTTAALTLGAGAFKLPGTIATNNSSQGIRGDADPLNPVPIGPPPQALLTLGSGNAASNGVNIDNFIGPPSTDLPPAQQFTSSKRFDPALGITAGKVALGGFNSLTLGVGIFVPTGTIRDNMPLPPGDWDAGGFFSPLLPWAQTITDGQGDEAIGSYTSQTSTGAGQAAQNAVTYDNIFLPPLVFDTPTTVQLTDGGVFNPTTGGAISGGRGNNTRALLTVANDLTTRYFTTSTAATSGRLVAPSLNKYAWADSVDLPSNSALLGGQGFGIVDSTVGAITTGFGQAAQSAVTYDNIELPPFVPDFYPQLFTDGMGDTAIGGFNSLANGFGQAAQNGVIVDNIFLPPATLDINDWLPPPQALSTDSDGRIAHIFGGFAGQSTLGFNNGSNNTPVTAHVPNAWTPVATRPNTASTTWVLRGRVQAGPTFPSDLPPTQDLFQYPTTTILGGVTVSGAVGTLSVFSGTPLTTYSTPTWIRNTTSPPTNASSLALTLSASPSVGNTLLVGLGWLFGATISNVFDDVGNTYSPVIPLTSSAGISNGALYAAAITIPGATQVTVQVSSIVTDLQVICDEYSGLALSGLVDQVATGTGTSSAGGAVSTGSTPTTTQATDLLYAYCAFATNSITGQGSGYTLRSNLGTDNFNASEDQNVTSIGSYSASFAANNGSDFVVLLAALKAASSTTVTGGMVNPSVASYFESLLLPPPTEVLPGVATTQQTATAYIFAPFLLPLSPDLPPQDYNPAGFGQAAQPPVLYSDIFALGAPRSDLPPQDYNPAGFGQAAQPPALYSDVLSLGAPRADLPPQDYTLKGFGQAAQPPVIVFPFLLPPLADLPPAQYNPAGFGQAAQAPVLYSDVLSLGAPRAELPPQDYHPAGFGQAAQPPVIVQPFLLPSLAELPPPHTTLNSGFGQAAQPPAIYTVPLVPPETLLPPRDALSSGRSYIGTWDAFTSGFGQAAQVPAIYSDVFALGAPRTELPPQDYHPAGFGQAAQPPVLVLPFLLPPLADLPPPQVVLAGFGQAAQPPVVYSDVLTLGAPRTELPPQDYHPAGFGQSAQPPVIFSDVLALGAPRADLPPQDYHPAGFGSQAQPPVIVFPFLLPPLAELSSSQYLTAGRGNEIFGPTSHGFGQAAQSPVIIRTDTGDVLLAPTVPELPPPQANFAGFGQAAQPPVIVTQPLVPPETSLPPRDALSAGQYSIGTWDAFTIGFGFQPQPAVIYTVPQDARTPTPVPPQQYLTSGRTAGFSVVGAITTGFGQAAQPPVIYTVPVDPRSPYPTATAELLAGFGQAAQTPVIIIQDLLPPESLLPPTQYHPAGFGQAAQPPVILTTDLGSALLPPFSVPDLPPPQYHPAGFGQAAQPPVIIRTDLGSVLLPPLVPELPPPQYHPAGFGQAAQPPVIYAQPLVPPESLLPPRDLLSSGQYSIGTFDAFTSGFGQAAHPPVIVQPFLLPPLAELPPPHTTLNAGFGQAAQPAVIVQPFLLPPLAELPPQDYHPAGFGQTTQSAVIVTGPVDPRSPYPTATAELLKGFGQAAQPPVIYTTPVDPRAPYPTAAAELLAGFGQAAQSPVIVVPFLLPPSAELPPRDALSSGQYSIGTWDAITTGFGQAAQPPVIIESFPAPYAILPPQDYVFAGFGQAAQPSVIVIQNLLPPETLLPPPQALAHSGPRDARGGYNSTTIGFGQAAQPPIIVTGPVDSLSPYPTTAAELLAGFGQAAQPPVIVLQDLLPPETLLPPTQYHPAGFGQAAQSPYTLYGDPAPQAVPDLPPPQFLVGGRTGILDNFSLGFGQAAQSPVILSIVPPISVPDLPLAQALPSGRHRSGQGSVDATSLGFGQAAQPSIIITFDSAPLPPQSVPDLPPAQSLLSGRHRTGQGAVDATSLGFGQAAQPPIIITFNPSHMPPMSGVEMPPPQYLVGGRTGILDNFSLGQGQAAQPPVVYKTDLGSVLTPFYVELPPNQWLTAGKAEIFGGVDAISHGFGLPPIFSFPPPMQAFVPPVTLLPPTPELYAGFGQAAQPPVTVYPDLYPAPYASLPPTDYVLAGFGQAAQPPVIVTGPIDPRAPYPTATAELLKGFGQAAQPPVVIVGPPDPRAPYPTATAEILAGFGQAAQPPVIITGPADSRAPYPTTTAELLAGFGQAAQPAVILSQPLVPPSALLPPQDYVLRGFGQAAHPPVIVEAFLLPPMAELPPQDYVIEGFGQAAQTALTLQAFNPQEPYPTTRPELFAGVPPVPPPSFLSPQIPPLVAEIPPPQSIFAGFGQPPQPAFIYIQPPAQYVSLPPISEIIKGFGTGIAPLPPPVVQVRPVTRLIARVLWANFFQPHDLPIYVFRKGMDEDGEPIKRSVGPYSVTYTLYQVRNSFLQRVGPLNHKPVPGPELGHFFVSGVVGEGGQPGIWMVRWNVQETFNSATITKDYYFEVLDAVAAGDLAGRGNKRGWN